MTDPTLAGPYNIYRSNLIKRQFLHYEHATYTFSRLAFYLLFLQALNLRYCSLLGARLVLILKQSKVENLIYLATLPACLIIYCILLLRSVSLR